MNSHFYAYFPLTEKSIKVVAGTRAFTNARDEEREVWQTVVANKDAEIARLREQLKNNGASAQ